MRSKEISLLPLLKTKEKIYVNKYAGIKNPYRIFSFKASIQNKNKNVGICIPFTPARTLFISGLKSRVMKFPFLGLKMMVKSGLEFILKLTKPLQRYLLSCQANSAILGRYFCTGQQQL